MPKCVLAGDVGGTKTNLAIYRIGEAETLEVEREASFPSRKYATLEEIVGAFLEGHEKGIAAAVFGLAGPVFDRKVTLTNLPWVVEAERLAAHIGCRRVRLLNDLAAAAYGTLYLPPEKLETLNPGVERKGNRAVIAAGTGLGQSILVWDGQRYHPSATEGGHVDFAPRTDREIRLLEFAHRRYGRVSFERVLSGPGLHLIFRFLSEEERVPVHPSVRSRLEEEDPSGVIGEMGLDGSCEASREAVDMFVSIYGAQAGNVALATLAVGGVYVAGGIVTKLLPKVASGSFLDAFAAKQPFVDLMREIPVHVVLDTGTSRLGAAHVAAEIASG